MVIAISNDCTFRHFAHDRIHIYISRTWVFPTAWIFWFMGKSLMFEIRSFLFTIFILLLLMTHKSVFSGDKKFWIVQFYIFSQHTISVYEGIFVVIDTLRYCFFIHNKHFWNCLLYTGRNGSQITFQDFKGTIVKVIFTQNYFRVCYKSWAEGNGNSGSRM